jgi:hypothetical protein
MLGELAAAGQLGPLRVRVVSLEDQILPHLIVSLSHSFLLLRFMEKTYTQLSEDARKMVGFCNSKDYEGRIKSLEPAGPPTTGSV